MTLSNDPATGGVQQFDFNVNLLKAILWQYNDAANIQAILALKQDWYDTNEDDFWSDWLANVFDLRTANEFGLSVWSVILGLPLFVNPPINLGPIFGFDAQTGYNFDNGVFGDQNTYQLPTETKRIALRLRYFQLVSSGTVPETNRMLAYVFKEFGQAWLIDNHAMTQTYIFNFPVTADLQYLFNNYDILPRPAGVASTWIDATLLYWGFANADYNFDNGIFGS
ncbi:MAG TPA: DUF2612 domain-containing protein [Gemmataceae bacterium]|nr:DUF2612 domain-containing protein [Gemmataceae bacterium]